MNGDTRSQAEQNLHGHTWWSWLPLRHWHVTFCFLELPLPVPPKKQFFFFFFLTLQELLNKCQWIGIQIVVGQPGNTVYSQQALPALMRILKFHDQPSHLDPISFKCLRKRFQPCGYELSILFIGKESFSAYSKHPFQNILVAIHCLLWPF